jgi:hypothetical protein
MTEQPANETETGEDTTRQVALYFFRKLVYLLYLEVGGLTPSVHPQLAAKAYLKTAFFQREKERQAAALYHLIENEADPRKIEEPFRERTGLTLKDVHRAFTEGDWHNKFGGFTSGGPRWASVAEKTLELRSLIVQKDWEKAGDLVFELKAMKTNKGYLVNQFERNERRR